MLNLIHAEFYKLNKSISLKICFLLSCICAAALVYISHCIAVGTLGTGVSGSASGLTEIVIVSFLGSLMTGILICSDFETKTIHDCVACGNGRQSIVISKVLIYLFIMILLLLPYLVATIVGYCSGAQFTKPFVASIYIQILSDIAGSDITAGMIGKIILVSFVNILVHASRIAICIPLAFKIRKPVAILGIGFVFNALLSLVVSLIGKVKVLKNIISFTPFDNKYLMLTQGTAAGTLWKTGICSIIFIGLITLLTVRIFRRAEIK